RWVWVLTSPGRRIASPRSRSVASSGAGTCELGPKETMRPAASSSTAASRRGAPATGTTQAARSRNGLMAAAPSTSTKWTVQRATLGGLGTGIEIFVTDLIGRTEGRREVAGALIDLEIDDSLGHEPRRRCRAALVHFAHHRRPGWRG